MLKNIILPYIIKNISWVLVSLLVGIIGAFLFPKRGKPMSYVGFSSLEYVGKLHLVNYSSDQLIKVFDSVSSKTKKEELERIKLEVENLHKLLKFQDGEIARLNSLLKDKELNKREKRLYKIQHKALRETMKENISMIEQKNEQLLELQNYKAEQKDDLIFLAIAPAKVSAYVDLSHIEYSFDEANNIFFSDSNTIKVSLPPPRLDSVIISIEHAGTNFSVQKGFQITQSKKDRFDKKLIKAIVQAEQEVKNKALNLKMGEGTGILYQCELVLQQKTGQKKLGRLFKIVD